MENASLIFMIAVFVVLVGALIYVNWPFNDEPDQGESHEIKQGVSSGTPVAETAEGKLYAQIASTGCPDCGTKLFAPGPQGGMMQNFTCENGHRFNISTMLGIAHRI